MTQIGKLALRQEGAWWVAYYDIQHNEQPKVELCRMHMDAMMINAARRDQFMTLARDLVGDLIHAATGIRPEWGGVQPAPESEKAGHS